MQHLHSQRLEEGIQCGDLNLRFRIKAYCGDYDSLRLIFSSKGAATRKPCLLCQNIVDQVCEAPAADDYFHDITSGDVDAFIHIQACELHSLYDSYLEDTAGKSKQYKKDLEKNFGFALNAKSLLASTPARDMLSVQHVMLDSCHNYWAKGICGTGMSLDLLRQSVVEVKWECADTNYCSVSARKFLFHESLWAGDCFKGEASKTAVLVPLLHYYGSKLANHHVASELESFRALYRATLCISELKRGNKF